MVGFHWCVAAAETLLPLSVRSFECLNGLLASPLAVSRCQDEQCRLVIVELAKVIALACETIAKGC